jgi:predicted Fe-S protein YdhL (DUF1289 family)
MTAPDVPSPCIRSCCLDDDDVCMGCGRSLDEIVAWNTSTPAEKAAIVERGQVRAEEKRRRREGR